MEKPTRDSIIKFVRTLPYRQDLAVKTFTMIEGFDITYRYAVDAVGVCKALNREFGSWIYVSICTFKRSAYSNTHTNVCISYRSKELS